MKPTVGARPRADRSRLHQRRDERRGGLHQGPPLPQPPGDGVHRAGDRVRHARQQHGHDEDGERRREHDDRRDLEPADRRRHDDEPGLQADRPVVDRQPLHHGRRDRRESQRQTDPRRELTGPPATDEPGGQPSRGEEQDDDEEHRSRHRVWTGERVEEHAVRGVDDLASPRPDELLVALREVTDLRDADRDDLRRPHHRGRGQQDADTSEGHARQPRTPLGPARGSTSWTGSAPGSSENPTPGVAAPGRRRTRARAGCAIAHGGDARGSGTYGSSRSRRAARRRRPDLAVGAPGHGPSGPATRRRTPRRGRPRVAVDEAEGSQEQTGGPRTAGPRPRSGSGRSGCCLRRGRWRRDPPSARGWPSRSPPARRSPRHPAPARRRRGAERGRRPQPVRREARRRAARGSSGCRSGCPPPAAPAPRRRPAPRTTGRAGWNGATEPGAR